MTELLEEQLDSRNPAERRQALLALWREFEAGKITLPAPGTDVNLHAHTCFSYNAYGYSPSKYAWLARKAGLRVAGVVDFDVLDALEEFIEAGRLLDLKTCVSLESRVFVPEFATRVINSPGEPGIAYHMGVGFARAVEHPFLAAMRAAAAQRTRDMLGRVNVYMRPVELDYEKDVVPLTPKGNATERHLCEAFERKAAQVFPDMERRAAFWREKLGDAPPPGAKLQNLIRARTMKKGGVGYVQPGKGSFPLMADMNHFVLDAGAIPALTWLDGTTEGEKSLEELFATAIASGAAVLNIIPDRNYTPGVKDQKLKNLYDVVEMAEHHHFPIVVGTEMNSPGNKFVDSFGTMELAPLVPTFLRGAHIIYAHSVLQRQGGLGYLSPWARKTFTTVAAKNDYFERLGRELRPAREDRLSGLTAEATPDQILARAN
ncbi:MAG TPA: hypothetical protein P5205_10085 [Candidatus Paceibacterota bacterium]|nr:hypothetical protein [Verrucomicrobiota bacterium]HSA10704.1 hypothetical protein [Candidatus Paceibacterota bacterium]